eukprot:PhM_4_TR433/c2_g1_i1/m.20119
MVINKIKKMKKYIGFLGLSLFSSFFLLEQRSTASNTHVVVRLGLVAVAAALVGVVRTTATTTAVGVVVAEEGTPTVVVVRRTVAAAEAAAATTEHPAATTAAAPACGLLLLLLEGGEVHGLVEELGHLLVGLRQDVDELARHRGVLLREEGDGVALVAAATGAANTVHVLVDVVRKVVLDDAHDVGDVEAARGDVRRHQDGLAGGLECREGGLALGLTLVTVDAHGGVAAAHEAARDVLDGATRLREDKGEVRLGVRLQGLREGTDLLELVDLPQALDDVLRRRADAADGEVEVVAREELVRKVLDLARERRREHERLAAVAVGHVGVAALHDLADLRLEAHVEHAVGLVEHETLDVLEADVAAFKHVPETAGRRDHEVAAVAELVELAADVDTAVQHGGAQTGAEAELAGLGVDLTGELAGGGHDNALGVDDAVRGRRLAGLAEDLDDHGQEEGGRLAGAGLGARHEIEVVEGDRDGVLLHRRGGVVLAARDVVDELLGDGDVLESLDGAHAVVGVKRDGDVVVLGEVDALGHARRVEQREHLLLVLLGVEGAVAVATAVVAAEAAAVVVLLVATAMVAVVVVALVLLGVEGLAEVGCKATAGLRALGEGVVAVHVAALVMLVLVLVLLGRVGVLLLLLLGLVRRDGPVGGHDKLLAAEVRGDVGRLLVHFIEWKLAPFLLSFFLCLTLNKVQKL